MSELHVKKGATSNPDVNAAVAELASQIVQDSMSFVLFYCSSRYDLQAVAAEVESRFKGATVVGCTTAGEISANGYQEGGMVGISIASDDFKVHTQLLKGLTEKSINDYKDFAIQTVGALKSSGAEVNANNTLAYLLVDGMCMQEESLVSTLYQNLPDIRLFGGSAGDDFEFKTTHVYHDGGFHADAALLTLISTSVPFEVFRTQHFVGTDQRFVVTAADVSKRIVHEINGLPAGREYARLVGLDVAELTPQIFSAYPVVVKVGGQYYVRSIQKVNDDESLSFFCAIDEGIVLTIAKGVDLVDNLRHALDDVASRVGKPQLVIGCDCVLRLLECGDKALKESVGQIMSENNVIGFNTYGEQYNAMHVNQTFTAVAFGSK